MSADGKNLLLGGPRADATKERFKLLRKSKTPEGFLDIYGVVATAGHPLEYTELDPGGARIETPTEDALRESVESLIGVPVTFEHPEVGLLDTKTAKHYAVGSVADAHYEEATKEQRVRLRIIDEEAIREIEAGALPDLSPGYRVTDAREATEEERAEHNVDVYQLQRSVNHVALTRTGRGDAPLRLDSKRGDNSMKDKEKQDMEGEEEMEDMSLEDMKAELDAMRKERDDMKAKYDAAMEAKADAEDKMDKLSEKVDAMEAKMDMMSEAEDMAVPKKKKDAEHGEDDEEMEDGRSDSMRIDAKAFGNMFREHKRALELADVLGLKAKPEDPTNEIKRRVVAHNLRKSDVRIDSKSDTYVEVAFDSLYERAVVTPNSPQALVRSLRSDRVDSAGGDLLAGIKITSRREQMDALEGKTNK